MVEIFLPEIDCDADNGVNIHSGFWREVYTTKIRGGIIREVLKPALSEYIGTVLKKRELVN